MSFVFGSGDLRGFFRTGPRVSFNGFANYSDGSPIQGLLDETVEARLADNGAGGVNVQTLCLIVPFNTWNPMPVNTETVIVDNVPYTVADTKTLDDGAFTRYELKLTQ